MTRPLYKRVVRVAQRGPNLALVLECGCTTLRPPGRRCKFAICDTHNIRPGE